MRITLQAFAALTALVLLSGHARAQDRPIVAVFGIEDRSKSLDRALLGQLTEYLATEVGKAGVFQIVPPGDIKRALQDKKTESYKECFDSSCQVELGRELAASKTLSTSVLKIGDACTVSAALYDLKRMATDLTASAKGECGPAALMGSLEKVAAELRAWGAGRAGGGGFQEGAIGGDAAGGGDWMSKGGEQVIARFGSTPAGATVLLDGKMVCKETPCSKGVPAGAHRVSMQAERYRERVEQVVIAKGASLDWKLEPDFGWLTVKSEPAGLEVKINGEPAGKTPIERREVAPGGYEVLVGGPCHLEKGERVKVERGQAREVSVAVAAREAGLDVKARDGKGNDLEADVYVDGQKVGATPGRFKVSICAREAEIRHAKQGSVKKALSLREREVTSLEVELKGRTVALTASMVKVPAGEFTMGCSPGDKECQEDEKPAHKVWVSEFFIDTTEVTVAEYRGCVESGVCSAPNTGGGCTFGAAGKEAHPINCVDWDQARSYCEWAGKRLPTEAEWEKAARRSTTLPRYGDIDAIAWYLTNSGGGTHPVRGKQPNGYGQFDMLGNVWEWIADWYGEDYYRGSTGRDPAGPKNGQSRLLRGGSFTDGSRNLRASVRLGRHPRSRNDIIGFRCVLPPR